MKFIVGLGNPGVKYQKTRHNIGRALVEFIAGREKAVFVREKKWSCMRAEVSWGGLAVQLVYPEVFMNLSGETVKKIAGWNPVKPETDFLIAVDDVALPFGMLRLRGQGSSGGHNGLKSIAAAFASEKYARLRLGIGKPGAAAAAEDAGGDVPMHDYVLDPFSGEEQQGMPDFLLRAEQVCRLWAEGPLEQAMNAVNQRVPIS